MLNTKLRPLFVVTCVVIALLLGGVSYLRVHTAQTITDGVADILRRAEALGTLRAIEGGSFRMLSEAIGVALATVRDAELEDRENPNQVPAADPLDAGNLHDQEVAQYDAAKVRVAALLRQYDELALHRELARHISEAWRELDASTQSILAETDLLEIHETLEKAEHGLVDAVEKAAAVEAVALNDETHRSFARVGFARSLVGVATIAGVGLAIIIGFVLATRIVRRIAVLKVTASRIGAGELDIQVDTSGSDEISELATAVKKMMSNLKRSYDDLLRKNKELDEFSYLASHDLQEPLRKLVSFSGLLREDIGTGLSETASKDLDFIADGARRMQRLIEDLLSLSRVGRTTNKRQSLELSDCVTRASDALEMRIRETGATIECDDLPQVVGDVTVLTQLYQNLIGNALMFVGANPPVIRVTASRDADGWTFGVRDNGIGIKPEYLQQIFAPFKRLHGRSEYEGTGIGLAICRKAVEFHGGTIWAESKPGDGAHFKFTLNRRPMEVGTAWTAQTAT